MPCHITSSLARCARRQSWVNEPTAELRPRLVHFEAARNPPTASLARLRIWPPPRSPRADSPDARAGHGVPRRGSHGGRGPPGSTPHHPRDAATTTVRAGDARAVRQNVDGSSLWRPSLGFRGRAELHRVVMCMVYVVHVSRDQKQVCSDCQSTPIHKEAWKLKGERTPVANGGVWCGGKSWFVKHTDDRPLDFASGSSSPEPGPSRLYP